MNRKGGFDYQFKRYVKVALPCGVLAGLALFCMDVLLFCKTIAKYFFGLDTIFALEVQLIGICSLIFAFLAIIPGSALSIYF